jgi:hypothetical protein
MSQPVQCPFPPDDAGQNPDPCSEEVHIRDEIAAAIAKAVSDAIRPGAPYLPALRPVQGVLRHVRVVCDYEADEDWDISHAELLIERGFGEPLLLHTDRGERRGEALIDAALRHRGERVVALVAEPRIEGASAGTVVALATPVDPTVATVEVALCAMARGGGPGCLPDNFRLLMRS